MTGVPLTGGERRRAPAGLPATLALWGAAVYAAERVEPGILDHLSLGAALSAGAVHLVVLAAVSAWQLREWEHELRTAEHVERAPAPPPAGRDAGPLRDAATSLAVAVGLFVALLAWDEAITTIVLGAAGGTAVGLGVMARRTWVARRERRLGRRYYRVGEGDAGRVVWTHAPFG